MNKKNMEKLEAFRLKCAGWDEDRLLCAEALIVEETELAWAMLEAIDKRLAYLETYTFQNITKLSNLTILPPNEEERLFP